jgi:hypothetical protein
MEKSKYWQIFLTVHDVGCTPQSFIDFVNHPSMATVKRHSVFLHVCVPGQDEGESDLLGDFPSMDQLGENLVHVLDALDVKFCIGLGEGAGADILCRFGVSQTVRREINLRKTENNGKCRCVGQIVSLVLCSSIAWPLPMALLKASRRLYVSGT